MDLTYAYLCGAVVIAVTLYNTFGGGFGKKPRDKYGIEFGAKSQDSTAPIRNFRFSKDELVSSMEGVNTLYDNFSKSRRAYGNKRCLGSRSLIGVVTEKKVIKGVEKSWQYHHLSPYTWETYEQVGQRIDNFASGLCYLGLKSGNNMAIYSETRAEWHIAANACFTQNIIVLTVYANLGFDPMIHALNEGEIDTIVTNGELIKGLLEAVGKVHTLKRIIYTEVIPDELKNNFEKFGIKLYSFYEVEKLGKDNPIPPNPTKKSSDLAVIMYTSGTTGMPKGVMLTHQNVVSTMSAAFKVLEIQNDDIHLSYLPLAHILAFVVDMAMFSKGASIGFGNPRSLSTTAVRNCKGDFEELGPTFIVGVPSVLDKIKQGIQAQLDRSHPIVRNIFSYAYNSRKNALIQGKDTPLWKLIIFNKFKKLVGGRVRFMVSGGAPLSPLCCEYLSVCFGVPVCQGYGLTETCGGSIVLELDSIDLSGKACGAPLPCCELKLVDVPEMKYLHTDNPPRGEIWIRGPSVSIGYYKNEKKTREEWTEDSWFKTGDIGLLHANGTFSIIDRIKNLIKPPHGEYIAPERLESVYKNSKFVDNLMVYASSKHNELIAFVTPNKRNLQDWAASQGLNGDLDKLCDDPQVVKAVQDDLNKVFAAAKLKSMERISAVKLFYEDWTPESGWITAAMKLRRNEIHKKYEQLIESMYAKLQPQ